MNNDAATGGALMPAESARFLAAADALLNDEADALGFLLLPDWRKPSADPSQRAAGELWEALLRAQVVHQNREREGIDYQTSRDRARAEVMAALSRAVACPDPALALRVVAAVTVMGWDIEAGTIRRGLALQAELAHLPERMRRDKSRKALEVRHADSNALRFEAIRRFFASAPAGPGGKVRQWHSNLDAAKRVVEALRPWWADTYPARAFPLKDRAEKTVAEDWFGPARRYRTKAFELFAAGGWGWADPEEMVHSSLILWWQSECPEKLYPFPDDASAIATLSEWFAEWKAAPSA